MRNNITIKTVAGCFLSISCGATAVAQMQNAGAIFELEQVYKNVEIEEPIFGGTESPEFIDWSSYFPIPGQQGSQNSCVGWAVGYGLKTFQEAHSRGERNPKKAFSPSYVYNSIKVVKSPNGDKCGIGSKITDAMKYLQRTGNVSMDDFGYDQNSCEPSSEQELKSLAKNFAISDYRRVENIGDAKKLLAAGFPIVIGMYVDQAFQNYRGGIYKQQKGVKTVGHAMVIVGYNDNFNAFKVLNSAGSSWGDGGYGWIHYDMFNGPIVRKYVAVDDITPPEFIDYMRSDIHEIDIPLAAANTSMSDEWLNDDIYRTVMSGLRGSVGLDVEGQTPEGFDYWPVSMWLEIPDELKKKINKVEYHFPGFPLPRKIPKEGAKNAYLIRWKGYGSLNLAFVKIFMNDGREMDIYYPHSKIWYDGRLSQKDLDQSWLSLRQAAIGDRDPISNCPAGTIPQPDKTCLVVE